MRYHEHPFFHDRYCSSHASDDTPSCSGCTRKQEEKVPFAQLPVDGRYLCLDCLGSVVLDTKEAQPLYQKVSYLGLLLGRAELERCQIEG